MLIGSLHKSDFTHGWFVLLDVIMMKQTNPTMWLQGSLHCQKVHNNNEELDRS